MKKKKEKEEEKKEPTQPEEVELIRPDQLGKSGNSAPPPASEKPKETEKKDEPEKREDVPPAASPSEDVKEKTLAEIGKEPKSEPVSSEPSAAQEQLEEKKAEEKPTADDKKDEKEKKKKPKKKGKALFLRVPLQEKVLFARHLSIGIRSGMTLIDALQLIHDQTKSKSLKIIIEKVTDDIRSGVFLSKSLEQYDKVFGNLFINIIRIGETSGTLSENLNYLTEELKKKHALRSKVRGALIYPAVVLVATLGIAAGMILFIFPKILPVFSQLDVQLPFTTRALIVISDALTQNGLWIGLGLVGFVILMIILLKFRAVKHIAHHMLFYVPVLKKMVIQVNMAGFARTLGLLLQSGVNIIEAINITADATSNLVYQHELKASASVLTKGEFLSSYLQKNQKLFPPISANMIRVGENTGNLVENLKYLSEYHEGQVDDFVKNLSSIIEPALMVVMGVIVGFIALSIITPIYSLTQGLQQ